MSVSINNRLRHWTHSVKEKGTIWFTGFFWIEDTLYEQQDAVDYLYKQNLSSDEIKLRTLLNQLNGQWAFIYKKFDLIISAVDHFRSILFSILKKTTKLGFLTIVTI